MISQKIIFAMRGALSDLQGGRIPNWSRSSPCYLRQRINGSERLQSIPAYRPAISKDGSFLLEPSRVNKLTWSIDLTKPDWILGANVQVRLPPTRPFLPDASGIAQEINWFSGVGNTQKLQRTFTVKGAEDYTLHFFLQPRGGRCGANDVIRVVGGVASPARIQLSSLNDFQGKYRVLEFKFRSAGTKPKLPAVPQGGGFTVSAVTNTTYTITGAFGVGINDLAGGQASFSNNPQKTYLITGNTATANESVVITVIDGSVLTADGVVPSSKGTLFGVPDQTCTLELYVENVFSALWGGVSLEEGTFSTSMINQGADLAVRAASLLEFQPKDNPLIDLTSFGVYGSLTEWKGDGNVADFGDLKISIASGKLKITAGATEMIDPVALPLSASFFVMVSAENSSLSLFVDGVLKNKVGLSNFRPGSNPLTLSSAGVRAWHSLVCFGQALLDGKPEIGGTASQEVFQVFNEIIVPAALISSQFTVFETPPVKVLGSSDPLASTRVTAISTPLTSREVVVSSLDGFALNDTVAIVRGEERKIIGYGIIQGVTQPAPPGSPNPKIELSSIDGIKIGDFLYKGDFGVPGQAFVRFPFVAIDEQKVQAVDLPNKTLTLGSSLAFIENSRAIVRNEKNQDVTEVKILSTDPATRQVTVDNASRILIGHYISQPISETRIPWQLYVTSFKVPISGVKIGSPRTENGVLIQNSTSSEVEAIVRIEVFL